ncbi:sulfite exporter TauE/SafE family protein [Thiomonas sp. FB-Cd]|uniref:sulfite exporter TauE/SafE family protein n=1 Tax=Thiomonas sp. FB-Cd TaxID=1158292 RepID=UPI0004DEEEDC|nr:sulfite exporter TauE/SafE family protein [Thiomonas sp. FB-Cd]
MNTAIILTLLLMGLTGGLHCAGMCGGLVVASERAMQGTILLPARRLLWNAAQMQLARVVSYAMLGAVAGWIGSGLWALQARPAQIGLYAVGNIVLAASGLWLLQAALGVRGPRRLALGAAAGRSWTQGVRQGLMGTGMRVLNRLLPLSNAQRRFGAGLLWGLLPCGLVYSALSLALLTGSAWQGAAAMAAFGLGTLPHMLLAGHVLRRLSQRATSRATRLAAAGVMLAFAAWGFWKLAHAGTSLGVHGFCVI